MAADILAYKATHVPVGEDQKQHLELARDIAGAFNARYGVDFFPQPEPQIFGAATRVMSLRDGTKKMSKSEESDQSRINLTDTPDLIAQKIKRAKTDPLPLPASVEELATRPEADNLLGIYAALTDKSLEAVVQEFAGAQFSTFKGALSDVAVAVLSPITAEMNRMMADPASIDAVLRRVRSARATWPPRICGRSTTSSASCGRNSVRRHPGRAFARAGIRCLRETPGRAVACPG